MSEPPEPKDAASAASDARKSMYKRVADNVGPTFPHYDVREGARTYASIGGVLAGFSFAAVVLLARFAADCEAKPGGSLCDLRNVELRNTAATAFLVAFFGCVSGAFVFAITGAEELLSKRAHSMAFFGSTGFVLGIGHAFWGLALLAHLFLSKGPDTAVFVANIMVIGVAVTAPALVAMPALHIKSAFVPVPTEPAERTVAGDARAPQGQSPEAAQDSVERPPRVSSADRRRALGPGYVVVACGALLLVHIGSQLENARKAPLVFEVLFAAALALAVIGVLLTLIIGSKSLKLAFRTSRSLFLPPPFGVPGELE